MYINLFRPAIVSAIFIVCDCITGIFKSLKNGSFTSTGLKIGGFNKVGEFFIIILAYLVDCSLPLIGVSIGVLIAPIVCTYITLMEIVSNYENLCEICPALKAAPISKYFGKIKSLNESEDNNNGKT